MEVEQRHKRNQSGKRDGWIEILKTDDKRMGEGEKRGGGEQQREIKRLDAG